MTPNTEVEVEDYYLFGLGSVTIPSPNGSNVTWVIGENNEEYDYSTYPFSESEFISVKNNR